jgi:hypothetical protein
VKYSFHDLDTENPTKPCPLDKAGDDTQKSRCPRSMPEKTAAAAKEPHFLCRCRRLSVFRCVYYDTLAPAMQQFFCTRIDKSRHKPIISRQSAPIICINVCTHVVILSQVVFSPYRDNVRAVYDKRLFFPHGFIVK